MFFRMSSAPNSSCSYPIVIIEHTFRGGLYGALTGLVLCQRPTYFYKVVKVSLLGAAWSYLSEYSKCSFAEALPWMADKEETSWIPGAIAGAISGSTVATAYRPILSPGEVAAFTAFSTVTHALNGYAEWTSKREKQVSDNPHARHSHPYTTS